MYERTLGATVSPRTTPKPKRSPTASCSERRAATCIPMSTANETRNQHSAHPAEMSRPMCPKREERHCEGDEAHRMPEQAPCRVTAQRFGQCRGCRCRTQPHSFPVEVWSLRTCAASIASASATNRRAPPERSNGYAPPASSAASTAGIPAAASTDLANSASARVGYRPTSTIGYAAQRRFWWSKPLAFLYEDGW